MRKLIQLLIAGGVMCATGASAVEHQNPGESIRAVATTGMIGDLVRAVGGSRVSVSQLMRPGVDPHLYKPTSADAAALSQADVIFYNGLMLEGRMGGLFERLKSAGRKVFAVAETIPANDLLEPAEFEGHYDPHLWFDAALWSKTVPGIVAGLSAADPDGAEEFQQNGKALQQRLLELDAWCRQMAASIPEESRILVTSHDAYNYFGRAYGFRVVALQGISTVSEAALADMASMADFIRQQNVKAIFVETSVNPAAMRRVAQDADVAIGGELFSDALGEPGQILDGFDVGTYEGMMRYNLNTIINALR